MRTHTHGSILRMTFRHFLRNRGYNRTQCKKIIHELGWANILTIAKSHGPDFLTVCHQLLLRVTEKPLLKPQNDPDKTFHNIDISKWRLE
jgi:hypothetical protein